MVRVGPGTTPPIQNIPGTLPIATKTSGTLPTSRISGVIAVTTLGTVLKSHVISVSVPGIQLQTGSMIRLFHAQPPSGFKAKVWTMGIKRTNGSGGLGSLYSVVYSESQGTKYRRGTAQYLTGTPLVTIPSGTRFSFRAENETGANRSFTAYFFATFE